MTEILRDYVGEFRSCRALKVQDAEMFLDDLINENDESLLTDVLVEWNRKGIEENEIYALAKIMRERCIRVNSQHEIFVDIVGTGGSRAKTFNVSSAAAFVVAGAGLPVAKHGNKAATSNSGSADVLASLGVEPAVDRATAERCLNEIGICFMFAPNFHRLSATLGNVRRRLGFPTIFNCVGPLCNPANAPHQLIGVWDKRLVRTMANALAQLGTRKSWIVHGGDGLDEITLSGPTSVAEVEGSRIREFELSPSEFGLVERRIENFQAQSAEESAAIIKQILQGAQRADSFHEIVLINASAALWLAGCASDLKDGVELANESIASGLGLQKLDSLAEAVRK